MTRRSTKQDQHAFYVPDGNAGEVWAVEDHDESGVALQALFSTQQTAQQYADWYAKANGLSWMDAPRKIRIHTKMKRVD